MAVCTANVLHVTGDAVAWPERMVMVAIDTEDLKENKIK